MRGTQYDRLPEPQHVYLDDSSLYTYLLRDFWSVAVAAQ